jgi:hypothetical protein
MYTSQALISIFVCVVLPVSIVLIVAIANIKRDKTRSQVIIKAIEANKDIDTNTLVEALKKPRKTAREILNRRLLFGCVFTLLAVFLVAVGIANLCAGTSFESDPVTVPLVFGGASLAVGASFLIVYFVTRKQIDTTDNK